MRRYLTQCGEFLQVSRAVLAAAVAGEWERLAPLLAHRARLAAAVDGLGLDPGRLATPERQAALELLTAARDCDAAALAAVARALADTRTALDDAQRVREGHASYLQAALVAEVARRLDTRR